MSLKRSEMSGGFAGGLGLVWGGDGFERWSGFGLRERRGVGLQRVGFGRELGLLVRCAWSAESGADSGEVWSGLEELVRSGGAGGEWW